MAYLITENGVITMFKGDDVRIPVELRVVGEDGGDSGEVYTMQPGDTLTFTVRRRPGAEYPVEFSTVSTTPEIVIVPKDTENMEVGKYSADIQLNYSGKVTTVFPDLEDLTDAQRSRVRPWDNFILTGEVTK